VNTLCEARVARKVAGQERLNILHAAGRTLRPGERLTVLELLIPASAYEPEDLARVNLMRAARGLDLPPITPETRPDITGMIGTRTKRKDAGKAAPQRRTKERREAEAAYDQDQPSLYSMQDLMDPPEDAFPNRHAREALGAPDQVALLDVRVVAGDDDADVVLFQVQRQTYDLLASRIFELEHLLVHHVLQAVDARDAIPDLQNLPDLLCADAVLVVRYGAL
jgi:hypothetical protein